MSAACLRWLEAGSWVASAWLLLRKKPVPAPEASTPPTAAIAPAAPPEWPQIQSLLEQHALPSLRIKLLNEKPARAEQSRFGGQPWWPAGRPYPLGKNGQALEFLAQINFSELGEPLPGYPRQGLLQFFIANDDLYGMDFIDQNLSLEQYLSMQKNFAVIYHPELSAATAATRKAKPEADAYLPHHGETALAFSPSRDLAGPADYRFRKILAPLGPLSEASEEYAYSTLNQPPEHKLGGYAAFTQEDPRTYQGSGQDWQLLLQIDSDANEHFEIMWGDVGIANFFIRPQDLQALDFSKVWFNWDCH